MPRTRLPPELWLMILDLAKMEILLQSEYYNHIDFPSFYHQLRDPRHYSSITSSYKRLCQVCKLFKAVMGSSPHFYMLKYYSDIPPNAQAVTIVQYYTSYAYLLRALEQRSIATNIVSLHFPCGFSTTPSRRADFDLLCINAGRLLNIRKLTLHFYDITSESDIVGFWSRLNTAFPLLVTLGMISWQCYDGRGAHFTDPSDSVIIFKHLEILVVDNVHLHPNVQLPAVRHVALAVVSVLHGLLNSPHLESLLFRGRNNCIGAILNITQLSPLRLLGMPFSGAAGTQPLPKGYPLVHICVFFISPIYTVAWPAAGQYHGLQDLVPWLAMWLEHIPSLSQITLDTSMAILEDQSKVEAAVASANFSSIGLIMPCIAQEQTSMVFERDPLFRPASKKSPKRKWRFSLF